MPAGYAMYQLSAGGLHSLVVGANASFGATGWNGLSQNSGSADRAVWMGFGAPGDLIPQVGHAASAGWYHSLLLHSNGSVLSSGWNAMGQLGDGTTTGHGWARVPGLTGMAAVSAGGVHNLALTQEGTLRTWGWNVVGQLGTGTTTDARSPVAIASLTNVVAASAGYLHSVAIRR